MLLGGRQLNIGNTTDNSRQSRPFRAIHVVVDVANRRHPKPLHGGLFNRQVLHVNEPWRDDEGAVEIHFPGMNPGRLQIVSQRRRAVQQEVGPVPVRTFGDDLLGVTGADAFQRLEPAQDSVWLRGGKLLLAPVRVEQNECAALLAELAQDLALERFFLLVVGHDAGEDRGMVALEVSGPVGVQGVHRAVSLVEDIPSGSLTLFPQVLGFAGRDTPLSHAERVGGMELVNGRRAARLADQLPNLMDDGPVETGDPHQAHHLFLIDHDPVSFSQNVHDLGVISGHDRSAVLALDVLGRASGLQRARPTERREGHQVVDVARLQLEEEFAGAMPFELEDTHVSAAREHLVSRRVVQGQAVEPVEVVAQGIQDLGDTGHHLHRERVDFEEALLRGEVHIAGDDARLTGDRFDADDVLQRFLIDQKPCSMN